MRGARWHGVPGADGRAQSDHDVRDQIAEVLQVHGDRNAERRDRRVLDLLEYVDLPDPQSRDAYPFQFSGGNVSGSMIAMALALNRRF